MPRKSRKPSTGTNSSSLKSGQRADGGGTATPARGSRAELTEQLLDRLAQGESLSKACRELGIDRVGIWKRNKADSEFSARLDEARQFGWLNRADEIMDFVSDEKHALSKETVQHARLQFDAMRWCLSKALPKIYGDKIALTDGDGAPLQMQAVVNVYRSSQLKQ